MWTYNIGRKAVACLVKRRLTQVRLITNEKVRKRGCHHDL